MQTNRLSSGIRAIAVLWLLVCLLAAIALWRHSEQRIEAERAAVNVRALKDAISLSRAYAAYLNRSLEQMDQITMHIKSDWERHQSLKLEELKKDGLFTASEFVTVAIIDRHGRAVSSTNPVDPQLNVADHDYFQFHRNNISTALRISKPLISSTTGKTVIYFSRRLDANNDVFDGVVLIGVDPDYFLAFYDHAILGDYGLLAVTGGDGVLRASTIGGHAFQPGHPALVSLQGSRDLESPRMEEDGNRYADKQPRFLASHELKGYPLTVMVGLSQSEILAPHDDSWNTYRQFVQAGTLILIVIAAAGSFFVMRLANRERQALAIRNTYRVATEGAEEGFYILSPVRTHAGDIDDWELADSNEYGAALFGKRRDQLIGTRLSAYYTAPRLQAIIDVFTVAQVCGVYEDECRVPDDSPIRANWLYRRVVRSAFGLAVTLRDISDSKKHEVELIRLANEDELTGLPNRHWLMRYLPVAMRRATQNRHRLAVLFLDLDEFKNVNDTHGHSTGDELLKIMAKRVQSVLRAGDRIVRLGGDEFTVIVEQVMSRDDAAHLAQRIVQTLKSPIELSFGKHVVGASVGVALFPDDGDSAETLLKNADIAMYSVKANGKGDFRFFEPSLYENLKRRVTVEQALRQAIEHDQFVLHYQPRVDTITGRMSGMEALVRWVDPERGMIPPLEFIPVAENTGLILALGELIIDKAARQISQWRNAQLPMVPVSINVSPRQFNEDNIPNQLGAAIARHGIRANDIQIEITESAMMGDQSEVAAQLAELRASRIALLVDDFGTGYSSLSQLQRLEMDGLKVDRAFTSELGQSDEGKILFKAIVSMAHALGMKVTAEGVETLQQLAILRALSCDEVQGYLVSRPVTADEMEALLRKPCILPSCSGSQAMRVPSLLVCEPFG